WAGSCAAPWRSARRPALNDSLEVSVAVVDHGRPPAVVITVEDLPRDGHCLLAHRLDQVDVEVRPLRSLLLNTGPFERRAELFPHPNDIPHRLGVLRPVFRLPAWDPVVLPVL